MQHIKEIKLTLFSSKLKYMDSFKFVSSESFSVKQFWYKQFFKIINNSFV
jgi:hypothetical protein